MAEVFALDPRLAAERPLSLWAYGVGATEGLAFAHHSEALAWLREHGFVPVDYPRLRQILSAVSGAAPGPAA